MRATLASPATTAPTPAQAHNDARLEVEDVDVLADVRFALGTGDDDVSHLDVPAQDDLPSGVGTLLEAWFPLGGKDNCEVLFSDETIAEVSANHGVSPAQTLIRWHLQSGNVCIPGSGNPHNGTSIYVTGDTSTTDDMRDGTLAAMKLDYAFWCSDGVYNMGPEEAAEAAAMVGAAHNIPYHNSTTDKGERFDRAAAERFAAPNAMVVYPGEDLEV